MLIILFLTACGSSEENQAKKAAEDYMEAVKNGDEIAEEYLYSADGFIDVFDFEYLQTLEEEKVKDVREYDYDFFLNTTSRETFPTFNDFKQLEIDMMKFSHEDTYEIIENTSDKLVLWDGESYNIHYTLLYNVEIANELGQKLFKKAEITLEPGMLYHREEEDNDKMFEESYVITDIYLR